MSDSAQRYVCAQTGARRGYAIPRILAQAGMLERFYTDLTGNVGWGRLLTAGRRFPIIGPGLKRLAARKVPKEIRDRTFSLAAPDIRKALRSLCSSKEPSTQLQLDIERADEIGRAAARLGFGNATHLYMMSNELTPLMVAAKNRGLTVVAEAYIVASHEQIVAAERKSFPGWDPIPVIREEMSHESSLIKYVDFFICPSEDVQDDLVRNWQIESERTIVVPYGTNPKWLDLQPEPQPGRILFVGTANLRKGIHYLAMAAEKLHAKGRNYEFRVAGHVTPQVRNQPICRHLNFLGPIPRDQVHLEFKHADVFALPSLAEGSAEVTYEALASALPLVTTRESGSVARDEVEGWIVPARDPDRLAERIESIVENRPLRERFSTAARVRGSQYTWDRYGDRLLSALKSITAIRTA